jgi:hypothetical protein
VGSDYAIWHSYDQFIPIVEPWSPNFRGIFFVQPAAAAVTHSAAALLGSILRFQIDPSEKAPTRSRDVLRLVKSDRDARRPPRQPLPKPPLYRKWGRVPAHDPEEVVVSDPTRPKHD